MTIPDISRVSGTLAKSTKCSIEVWFDEAMFALASAQKFGLKTAEKPRLRPDQTDQDRHVIETAKDCNRGPVFGLCPLEDREKPVLTSLNQSLLSQRQAWVSLKFINFKSDLTNNY